MNLVGQRLGQYEILARFGEGGMATVYRARQLSIKREVAIKVILPSLAAKSDFNKRFEKEAQIIASLSNPHIVKVFDYGVLRGFHLRLVDAEVDPRKDLFYLVMELLMGGSLADRLEAGPLPLDRINRTLIQVADALDYAHSRGYIHRDLKPPNVLYDDQDNAFLTDFGIAKLLGETTSLTQEGTTVGTPSYMAPEQWEGENVGPATDLYALGVVLFEMLAGQLPFIGSTPYRVMHMHVNDPPPAVTAINPNLPPDLDAILARALAKQPAARYESASALAQAFNAVVTGGAPITITGPANIPSGGGAASAAPTRPHGTTAPWPPPADAGPELESAPEAGGGSGSRRMLIIGGAVVAIIVIVVLIALLLNAGGG
jgi:serine/threonine protein kinase